MIESKIENSELKNILLNTIERPSSKQAINFTEEDILETAKEIGYEINSKAMDKIYAVHEAFMPVIENGLAHMLSQTEKNKPDYYAFARDGEMFFDALWGIGKAEKNNLQERIHYLKTSQGMEYSEDNSEYLNEIGITNFRFEHGPKMIFMDSGFEGSLFYKVSSWVRYKGNLPNANMTGYLASSDGEFNGMRLNFLNEINEDKIREIMKDSLYSIQPAKWSNFRDLTCAFMQITPKFTGRYVKVYKKENGTWDVLPEQNNLISRLAPDFNKNSKQLKSYSQENSIKNPTWEVNADIVNPLASILIQKRTLKYFTDSKVHDRIYSKVEK